ncbi:hypothetical protein GCM10010358_28020 [Streptomyces minutiscleroticus]|uniref:Methyltransferase n=1 Tax=Streptomyces minutiscleroticus TaxID=68238 RepID=A0A918NI28_9ACTN|nr:SAM-dependent methyltransferase [Streptomyces minutiscleroticus]GGX72059.1 hypothetical protein GCM10010358_28020 [Streptomyces minutiscleroticus]
MTGPDAAPTLTDPGRPHPARVYDWWLGGKDNYPVDEELGRGILAADPTVRRGARANRRFMLRATRALAEGGIRQFLDIGTGIPTEPNLHQAAQEAVPEARVVYADNDPVVLRHAQALLRGSPQGRTDYVHADVRDPETILRSAAETLDLDRPVALSLVALTHYLAADEDDAYGLLGRYMDALAPGSCLVLSQVTQDLAPERMAKVTELFRRGGTPFFPRSHTEVSRFFDGLHLLDPGVVPVLEWRPGPEDPAEEPVPVYAAVGRKP